MAGHLVRFADPAGGSGHEDQAGPRGVESRGGAQRQGPGAAGHLARPFGGHELHAHQTSGGLAPGVEHFVRRDDVQGIESVEQDDLDMHGEGLGSGEWPGRRRVHPDANRLRHCLP